MTVARSALRLLRLPRPSTTLSSSGLSSVIVGGATAVPVTANPRWNAAVRWYRGQADEAPPVLSEKEAALLQVALPRADAIRERHLRLPDVQEIPPSSLAPTATAAAATTTTQQESNLDIRRKRLVYRSKQRGWLEVDLLLGTWAHENVHKLTVDELDQYEAFINQETIDIYNVITLRLDVPEHMKTPDGQGVVERIQAWARASPLGQADPEKYKQVKTASKLI
jgi:succinate dehydrogenase assembly factor 2